MSTLGAPSRVVLGVTGAIASGKTTLTRLLAARGAHILDADSVVHALYATDTALIAAIGEQFGAGVIAPRGSVDRAALGAVVFTDPAAMRRLEALVHPAVLVWIDQRLAATAAHVVVIDAVKLVEGELHHRCDEVWVVHCRPHQQLVRLMQRNGLSRRQADQRLAAQNSFARKVAQATVVLDNSGSPADFERRVERAWTARQRAWQLAAGSD